MNMPTTNRFRRRLINAEIVPDITTMYRGKLIFLSSPPLLTTAFKPPPTTSVKKFQRTIPRSRAIGQWGISFPIPRKRENIVYNITNRKSGRKIDHRYPSVDDWYRIRKSVATSSRSNINEYLYRLYIFECIRHVLVYHGKMGFFYRNTKMKYDGSAL